MKALGAEVTNSGLMFADVARVSVFSKGKHALHRTRLSFRRFRDHEVRPQLYTLATVMRLTALTSQTPQNRIDPFKMAGLSVRRTENAGFAES